MPGVWCVLRAENHADLSDGSSSWDVANFVEMTGEPDNLSVAVVLLLGVWARSLCYVELTCGSPARNDSAVVYGRVMNVACSKMFRGRGLLYGHTRASTGVNSMLGEALRSVEAVVATSRRISLVLWLLFQKFRSRC